MVFTKATLALSFVALALAAPTPQRAKGSTGKKALAVRGDVGDGLTGANGLGGTLGGTLGYVDGAVNGAINGGIEEGVQGATNGLGKN